MKIILDNIVFSIQRSGGVSVLWNELVKKLQSKKDCEILYLDFNRENIFRKNLMINAEKVVNNNSNFNKLKRFINPKLNIKDKHVFCSSYYRTSKDLSAINVTIVHDFTYEYFMKGLPRFIHSLQKKRAIEKSDGIICISEHTKKDLLKFLPNVDESKIRVIHNGVSEDFKRIEKEFTFEEVDYRFLSFQDKKLLIFIGHRTSYKNFDVAVRAFAELNDLSFHFLIIGTPLSRSELLLLNKTLRKESFTNLCGIDNEKLNFLYNKAYALIYPSSYEGFGIPVLEAMKTGLPVIALNTSSIPEVAGEAGILLENLSTESINSAIIRLNDINYRNTLILKGLSQAEKFSWDKTMVSYYDFFKELYSKRPKVSDFHQN